MSGTSRLPMARLSFARDASESLSANGFHSNKYTRHIHPGTPAHRYMFVTGQVGFAGLFGSINHAWGTRD